MHESFSLKIRQETSAHLDENLDPFFYANDFCEERSSVLFKHLSSLFSKERVLEHTPAIKKGMQEYFEKKHQKTEVTIETNIVFIKNIPKSVDIHPSLDRALCRLDHKVFHLLENMQECETDATLKKFSKENLSQLLDCFKTVEVNVCDTRVYIRDAMKKFFQLHQRDMIFFFTQKMYVRHFVDNKKLQERRFNSFEPEKLEEMVKESFPDDFSEIIMQMVSEFEDSSLNFSRMDNAMFHKGLIDNCRGFIDVLMLPYIEAYDEGTILALNGYILRNSFDKILAAMADILLKKVLLRDKNADKFLKYYNGDTIMEQDGKKIQKRGIVDKDNNNWNYSAIFSIITQHKQAGNRLQTYKEDVKEKEELYLQVYNKMKLLETKHDELAKENDDLDTIIIENKFSYNSLKTRALKEKSPELRDKAKLMYKTLMQDAKKHVKLKEGVSGLSIQVKNLEVDASNRKQHFDKAKKGIKEIEAPFNKLDISYKTITSLLARAITGR